MNASQTAEFLLQLPGVREDLKWGDNRVFSVAQNKMVAIINFLGQGIAFKVDSDLFLGYVDRPASARRRIWRGPIGFGWLPRSRSAHKSCRTC